MSEPVIPILLDIPESIETERLLIRAARWGDGAEMNAAIIESLKELKPWMIFAQKAQKPEETEIYAREARINYLKRSNMHMNIYNRIDGTFIGCSGLHHIDWDIRSFELGYWIKTACSGKGYMTEAVHAITNFAIQELEANRIEIRCSGLNAKSAAVAERAGYKLDGILRLNTRGFDGELHDSKVYAKVRGAEY
ncbi:GNAT family N-acetyltransferase [Paenibacillus sp. FSL R7-0345]|uniref:GNAT family N-acetyltransferase n=1 Tax=Paenibacillus sp. FSL R7-0345 TaxID=2954535 RepID=UPI00315A3322